jgi:hypothetical protein
MAIQQKDKFGSSASTFTDKAREMADEASGTMKETASTVSQKAADAGSYVAGKASDAGSYFASKAEDATTATGSGIKSLAGTIRDKGPHDGMLGNATSAVANTLESCGAELEHGLSGITEDITKTIRRHPIPSVFIGLGLGFLLARVVAK